MGNFLILVSLLLFTSCTIPRPKGLVCVAHLEDPPGIPVAYNRCFDMEEDFDSSGTLIPGHNGIDLPLVIDKHINMDVEAFASLSAYMQKVHERLRACESQ